jgi:hypothetical protein
LNRARRSHEKRPGLARPFHLAVDRSGYAALVKAPAAPAIAGTNAVWLLAVILPAARASAPGWNARPAN